MCRCLGVNLLQWNVLLEASKTFKVNPRHPNILPLLCIWVKCAGVWGNIFPKKWAVFIKLYPMSKACMLLTKILPQTSKIFTQIYLPYLWHFATLTKRQTDKNKKTNRPKDQKDSCFCDQCSCGRIPSFLFLCFKNSRTGYSSISVTSGVSWYIWEGVGGGGRS